MVLSKGNQKAESVTLPQLETSAPITRYPDFRKYRIIDFSLIGYGSESFLFRIRWDKTFIITCNRKGWIWHYQNNDIPLNDIYTKALNCHKKKSFGKQFFFFFFFFLFLFFFFFCFFKGKGVTWVVWSHGVIWMWSDMKLADASWVWCVWRKRGMAWHKYVKLCDVIWCGVI